MTSPNVPRPHDVRQVRALAAVSALVLVGIVLVRVFTLPSVAPRVNIRWADSVDDRQRSVLEQQFRLMAGERREGSTWAYDLRDPSWSTAQALVAHPAVADTHYINRRFGIVAFDAPRGTTPMPHGVLRGWRDSPVIEWADRVALFVLLVSLVWLATTGVTARNDEVTRQTSLSA